MEDVMARSSPSAALVLKELMLQGTQGQHQARAVSLQLQQPPKAW